MLLGYCYWVMTDMKLDMYVILGYQEWVDGCTIDKRGARSRPDTIYLVPHATQCLP
jgi:hypothetical protein